MIAEYHRHRTMKRISLENNPYNSVYHGSGTAFNNNFYREGNAEYYIQYSYALANRGRNCVFGSAV